MINLIIAIPHFYDTYITLFHYIAYKTFVYTAIFELHTHICTLKPIIITGNNFTASFDNLLPSFDPSRQHANMWAKKCNLIILVD